MDGGSVEVSETSIAKDKRADIAAEIKERHQPLDYAYIVGETTKVLFLGEAQHRSRAPKLHLAAHARDLREAGITHFAIEADEAGNDVLQKLNAIESIDRDERIRQVEAIDLSGIAVGPGDGKRVDNEEVIKAMAAEGIKVVAVDIDQSTGPTKEQREERMTTNLMKIVDDPGAKVAYLVGEFHTAKDALSQGVDSTRKRITEKGISSVTVHLVGGDAEADLDFRQGVQDAGLEKEEFMVDIRPSESKTDVLSDNNSDFLVHLSQDGTPQQSWRFQTYGGAGQSSTMPTFGGMDLLDSQTPNDTK